MPNHAAFERAKRKFDVMGELGTDLMLICSNTCRQSLLAALIVPRRIFVSWGELAAKRSVQVRYERLLGGATSMITVMHVGDRAKADHPVSV